MVSHLDSTCREPITQLLAAWSQGDSEALEVLLPLVYSELKAVAHYQFNKEKPGHTLQATALVHEAYLSIFGETGVHFQNRSKFFHYMGQVMRHLLVGYARSRETQKRGGEIQKQDLMESVVLSGERPLDITELLSLDEALTKLAGIDARQAQIVELRFFAGMNHKEISKLLEISVPTVKREWAAARCWLSFYFKNNTLGGRAPSLNTA